jgi:TolB protein
LSHRITNLLVIAAFTLVGTAGSDCTAAVKKTETPKRKVSKDAFAWFPDGHVQQLSPGVGLYCQPCVHPAGTHVVFWGNSSGCPRIWQADLKTGKTIALTGSDTGARHPVYSWDGTNIVFASDRASRGAHEQIENIGKGFFPPKNVELNLFVMDADGKNVRQITTGAHQDHRPCFSPDGKEIVFASNRLSEQLKIPLQFRLWSLSADGQTAPRLLQKQGWGYRPWYAVDGKSVFFFTGNRGRHRICTIPADGGEVTPFAADDQGQSHGPFADPNGKYLLMHSSRGGKWRIWEVPLDGGRPRPLSPPGLRRAGHATRAKNGVIAFDGDK